jgi:hypothetical protein
MDWLIITRCVSVVKRMYISIAYRTPNKFLSDKHAHIEKIVTIKLKWYNTYLESKKSTFKLVQRGWKGEIRELTSKTSCQPKARGYFYVRKNYNDPG